MSESEIALFELLRAGLWEKKSQFSECDDIDYQDVYRIAVEQSVVGLVAIGLEYVSVMVPHQWAMAFAGSALQIERRNKAMNSFVVELIERLNEDGIYSLLIKGQGIA